MKKKKGQTLFNATLVTNKGLIVKDIFVDKPEEVIPLFNKALWTQRSHTLCDIGW